MKVKQCDICHRGNAERFKYRIKVKKQLLRREYLGWYKVDICPECQEKLIKIIKDMI